MIRKKKRNGIFIVFEGVDKTGKTTQCNLLKELLLKNKIENVITSFEPGDSIIGKPIRSILLDKNLHISNLTEFLLFIADRLEHTIQLIIKNMDENKIVIVDRFHFSTFSYQVFPAILKVKKRHYKDKDELSNLKSLIKMDKTFGSYLFSIIQPDAIFYFLNDKLDFNRLEKNDRFESRGSHYLKDVLNGYELSFSYYKNFKNLVYKIPFSNGIEKNKNLIYEKILQIIDNKITK